MLFRALDIYLHDLRVGRLFQYGEGPNAITRLIPDEAFWKDPSAPILSWSAVTQPADRDAFWRAHVTQAFFNGQGSGLPPFLQNLLPEGALRRHLAQMRGCALDDHFELLAACGRDLPGAITALPAHLSHQDVALVVTQNHDALEPTVTEQPMADAHSLSGVQPKMSLVHSGGRYVARTQDGSGTPIIAKLPTVEFDGLPQLEHLSLQLAAAAGVNVCRTRLAPISDIMDHHQIGLDHAKVFLAVERFDRQGAAHIHCEDFAQVLGILPDAKYTHPLACYALMAKVMLQSMALPIAQVQELLRRITVNELLGNYDGHVKNFGVIYQGRQVELSPAYDVVAYSAYLPGHGHALKIAPGVSAKDGLSPAVVRQFCAISGCPEPLAGKTIRDTVAMAVQTWPRLLETAPVSPLQKQKILRHFDHSPLVVSHRKRLVKRTT